jgi:hypothetical protein
MLTIADDGIFPYNSGGIATRVKTYNAVAKKFSLGERIKILSLHLIAV